jgi:hypothetical protein
MRKAFFVAFVGLVPALAQVSITATPEAVEVGAPVTLSWRSPGTSAFIDGIGVVPPNGSRRIALQSSNSFTLVSEGATGGFRYASVSVKVNGERGDSVFPDPDDFPPGVSAHRTQMLYTKFLSVVFATLQDTLKFRVRGEHLPDQTFYVFFTDRQSRPDLVRPTDRGVRSRRVAYWVRADEPRSASDVPFEVKAIIEYQRLAEAKWRPETDQGLVTELANRLKQQLITAQAGAAK